MTTAACTIVSAVYEDGRTVSLRAIPESDGMAVDKAVYEVECILDDVLCGRFDQEPDAVVVTTVNANILSGSTNSRTERVFDVSAYRLLVDLDYFIHLNNEDYFVY